MYRACDVTQGEAARLYRTPAEIRRDMSEISLKIKDASEMLNVRNMLMEILAESAGKPVEVFLMELEDMIGSARDMMSRLGGMRDSMEDLAMELEDARWAMRV